MNERVAVIGGGPAGLAAAEMLAMRGFGVDVYDAMPSFGRKFLMAGKSGLNITHAEDLELFLSRYTAPDNRLVQRVRQFPPEAITHWMQGLGVDTFTGSTGRVFPTQMKASPLLRAWLSRLDQAGVQFHRKHRWTGRTPSGALCFDSPDGELHMSPAATILALGGGSWRRLGSDGRWMELLKTKGVVTTPFTPSNCGFLVDWSDRMRHEFAGAPVKTIKLTAPDGSTSRSEFVVTKRGVESGGVYSLSIPLLCEIKAKGAARLTIDLLPDLTHDELLQRLKRPRGKQSTSNFLRKTTGLTGVKLALLIECTAKDVMQSPPALADAIKALPLTLAGPVPIDEAISTAGGVLWDALDDQLMLKALPGVFCAGEMIDWDAPTGGYLLTACLATGRAAGIGASDWLSA